MDKVTLYTATIVEWEGAHHKAACQPRRRSSLAPASGGPE
jgi:hypothetical protein